MLSPIFYAVASLSDINRGAVGLEAGAPRRPLFRASLMSVTPNPTDRINWWLVLAVFAIAVGTLVTRAIVGSASGPLHGDTDDAMRMVVVRDFLAGQNWYDIVQHRLNTPYGAEVHWSRLVDLPIALIVLAATPFSFGHAELVAAYVWPLLLLLVLLVLSARLSLRLVGPAGLLPAVTLPVLSPAVTVEFTPGRIDHHSIQIILTLALACACIEALKRPRFALLAGFFGATALAIGTEAVPMVAAAISAIALLWVFDTGQNKAVRGFGLSFAGAALIHLAIALPPSRWLVPACDAMSSFYVGAALAVGVIFTGISLWSSAPKSPLVRLVIMALAGSLGLAATIAIAPQCLGGPYAGVDPWLMTHWIDAISEARPWWKSAFELPAYTIAVAMPGIVGLIVMVNHILRIKLDRAEWLVLLLFLTMATLVMALQVRGARLVTMPAIPAAAWLILSARQKYLARPKPIEIAGLVASWLAFSGMVMVLLITFISQNLPGAPKQAAVPANDSRSCLMHAAFADLSALPPERIMAPIDLGAHLLMETPHSVVAAPYHRNGEGVRDTFDFFNLPIDQARTILDRRGIGLIVTCPTMPEMDGFVDAAPNSFVRLAATNTLPDWIKEVSTAGPLRIYQVLPR